MKIYYWSPFFSNIATEKAVINSLVSINKYSNKKISPYLLEIMGEWKNQKENINEKKIKVKKLLNFDLINFLPKRGFVKSRISYLIVFIFSIYKLHKLLKSDKPDFLIVHLMTFIPLILLSICKYETRFILRISGYPKLNFLRRFFWKLIGKKIFLVTTPTKSTLSLLKGSNIFGSSKIRYLPDPVLNINEIQKKKNENNVIEKEISKKNTLVSIGRLTKQKNFEFLIKVFHELNNIYPNLNLCIIGEGEEKNRLNKKIKEYRLENKIFLLGYKDNVYDYLKNTSVLILPSLWEDPGFVLIEAGYMNKIILSSDCPNSPRELLEDGKNGFIFKSNDSRDFLKQFKHLYHLDEKKLFSKKILYKKRIKEFTLFNHYKILSNLIFKYEN